MVKIRRKRCHDSYRLVAVSLGLACLFAAAGCLQGGLEDLRELPVRDPDYFRCSVEPVLMKRCAFSACHGNAARPYRIYAPSRLRLNASSAAPLTAQEHAANFENARIFAGDAATPRLLQLKGLSAAAGGFFHRGEELFGGGDVFASQDDPGYQAIVAWSVDGVQADTNCTVSLELGP